MSLIVADRVKETTTTEGTGAFTLLGAVNGFSSFSSRLASGDVTFYAAVLGTQWEVGLGTLTSATSLTRTTVLASSNADALVPFAAGTKEVFLDFPAALASRLSDFAISESTVASAATVDLGAQNSRKIAISGTAAITSFGSFAHGEKLLRFTGACTLTHNATSLILPTGANIVTAAGDTALATSDGSGNWRLRHYQRADGSALVALDKRRNRINDPGMRVSQENANNALSVSGATATSKYPSDSVLAAYSIAAGAATVQRVAASTPGGSPYRNRFTVTTANASPAAADYVLLETRIEGADIADLLFGTAGAHRIAVRLGVRSSVAGTFPVAIQNGASNRSWVGSISIAANEVGTDVVKTAFLIGDTTGTWTTDNTTGLQLSVGLCVGTNLQGVAGWQAGNFVSMAGMTNLMATSGATFDVFDLGLYDVTGLQQSVVPPFELESYPVDLIKCQRYWTTAVGVARGYGGSSAALETPLAHPVEMRITPTAAIISAGSRANAGTVTVIAVNNRGSRFYVGGPNVNVDTYSVGDIISLNARM